LRYVPQVARALWQENGWLVAVSGFFRVVQAILPVVILWVSKLLIDSVVIQARSLRHTGWSHLWLLFGAEFVLMVAGDGLSRASSYTDTLISDRFSHRIGVRLLNHADELDLESFENPMFQDRLERARSQMSSQLAVLMSIAQLLQTVTSLVVMVAAVALYAPWLVALQLIAVVPIAVMESHFAAVVHRLYRERTPLRRSMEYLLTLATSTTSVKEVKSFHLGRYIAGEYDRLGRQFQHENAGLSRQRNGVGAALTAFGSAGYYAGYAYLVWEASLGRISIGTLFFLSGAFQRAKGQLQGLFSTLSRTLDQAMYLRDVFEFFEMEPRVRNSEHPIPVDWPMRTGFEFRKVSFAYAGSARLALDRISFRLDLGETLALVGANGAGKSTLTKLLARLYDPTEGVILLNGVDLREYDLESLHRAVSIVYQDFVRYELTAGINIGFGDVKAKDDLARLDAAAHAGLALPLIRRLPRGYEQIVGKRFDGGMDLSGGEWQKLALSRACMRDAQLLILDEPAAALDARAEAALFDHFAKLTAGKMAVLISHRFSTVRMAHRILVLEHGRLKEQGSHEDLIARHGEYAALFRLQAAGYQSNFAGVRANGAL
jgi:ATP-binding cassette subfamily B protein